MSCRRVPPASRARQSASSPGRRAPASPSTPPASAPSPRVSPQQLPLLLELVPSSLTCTQRLACSRPLAHGRHDCCSTYACLVLLAAQRLWAATAPRPSTPPSGRSRASRAATTWAREAWIRRSAWPADGRAPRPAPRCVAGCTAAGGLGATNQMQARCRRMHQHARLQRWGTALTPPRLLASSPLPCRP